MDMRVLVSAVPAVGHVVPLLGLAKALQLAGHEIQFATNRENHRLVASAGLHPLEAGMSLVEMRDERHRRWPETDGQPASDWATRMWAQIMAPSTLKDLLAIMADWQPHVVVHDEGDYAGPIAAAKAGIPWVTHGWGSPLRPIGELTELEELAGWLWVSNGLDVPASAGLYQHALVNPCPRFLQKSFPGVALEWPIRPMPLEGHGEMLQADAYVGFGSVPAFANALAELTAAVRSCTDRGMKVVVTAPSADLRSELAAIDHDLVEARDFVRINDLLPSCKIAITHAGAGTVLASLSAAVPLVLIPRGTPSQIRMAQACDRAGVARSCVGAWEIDSAVDEVLSNPAIATEVAFAARQIATMPAGGEVVARVEELVSAQL
jgi:UDP:flavonoid glycosyltransferase YjiC (YdhE family)